jgi:hypothetical protein
MRALVFLVLAAPGLSAQTLIPTTITAPAPSRFEVLARSIDSASKVASSMQMVAADRERRSQETGRLLFVSAMASGFGRRPNWMSAATAIGMSQLFGSLKGDGQMAGFAGLTGGASWLLASLIPHAPLHFRNVRIAR